METPGRRKSSLRHHFYEPRKARGAGASTFSDSSFGDYLRPDAVALVIGSALGWDFVFSHSVRVRRAAEAKFTTWLLKITRNLVFNEMRRTKRRPHLPLHSEPGAEDPPFKDETNLAPDASLLESELQQAIEEAIERLPETQRMALVLRRYQQLSYEQIAEVLDLSVPAVKSVLFRARTELRSRLSKYLD